MSPPVRFIMRSAPPSYVPVFALCSAGMGAIAIAANLPPVLLTTLGADLGGAAGLTYEQRGRLLAALFTGVVSALVATGPVADRSGARPFAVGGNLLVALGLLAIGLARSYGQAAAGAFALGFGSGTLDMVLSPLVAVLRPDRRGVDLNRLHAVYCVGAIAVTSLAALLLRWGLGWRGIAFLFAVAPLASAAGFARAALPPLVARDAARTRLRHLLARPAFLVLLGVMFGLGGSMAGISQWLPAFAQQALGLTAAAGGAALSGFAAGMGASRVVAGWIAHRVTSTTLIRASAGATAVLALVAATAPWPPVALAACVLVGFGGGAIWPSVLAMAADRFPHGGGTMFGLMAAMGNIGCMTGAWAVGVVADAATLRAGLAVTAIPALLILVLLRAVRRAGATDAAG